MNSLAIAAILLKPWDAFCAPAPPLLSEAPVPPPAISSLLKPLLWKRMMEEKEVIINASLRPVPDTELRKYSFYAAMMVRASLDQTRQILTNYKLYSDMIPYVDKAEYSLPDHTLLIEGGIWNFRLRSQVLFEEAMDRWIHYKIVGGHFSGLTGDIYFESKGEKGTVVYFTGGQSGTVWPPQFVIERGAEIVFGFTANRMRSYIESRKKPEKEVGHGQQDGSQVPQPRSHF